MGARGPDATQLMNGAAEGAPGAAGRLIELVYDQLRRAAQEQISLERRGHSLSATALVHEAYLKLVGTREVACAGRGHFYAAAAEAMRRVLLDHAKARGRRKRGGGRGRAEFSSVAELLAQDDPEQIVSFDAALCRLETESSDAARPAHRHPVSSGMGSGCWSDG